VAFRLHRGESIRHAIGRMAREELEEARKALLSDRSATRKVHDVRTAIKKVRALARCVRPAVGKRARRADRRLRRIARDLAPARDAHTLATTFSRLARDVGRGRSQDLRRARQKLGKRIRKDAGSASARRLRRIADRLAKSRDRVDRWMPDDEGWKAIGEGFARSYRRARRAMRRARTSVRRAARKRSGVRMHAWRRTAKAYGYQARALEPVWPKEMEALRSEIEMLGDLLGREHDLTVLESALREEGACPADRPDCGLLLAKLEGDRRRIRREAAVLGDRLFAEKPGAMRKRMKRYFEAFEEEPVGTAARLLAHASPSIAS
jgi:CHAD domain-containing protein